jgi:hypothetical protein
MKNCAKLIAVQAGWLLMAALTSPGQTSTDPAPAAVDSGGRVIAPSSPSDSPLVNVSPRPTRDEQRPLPTEVEARINRFKADARAYLERQEALRKQFQGASAEERARIRAQLETLRREWLERAKELRRDFSERRADLADKLPAYKKMLLDDVKNGARDELKDQKREVRDRRGTD